MTTELATTEVGSAIVNEIAERSDKLARMMETSNATVRETVKYAADLGQYLEAGCKEAGCNLAEYLRRFPMQLREDVVRLAVKSFRFVQQNTLEDASQLRFALQSESVQEEKEGEKPKAHDKNSFAEVVQAVFKLQAAIVRHKREMPVTEMSPEDAQQHLDAIKPILSYANELKKQTRP